MYILYMAVVYYACTVYVNIFYVLRGREGGVGSKLLKYSFGEKRSIFTDGP